MDWSEKSENIQKIPWEGIVIVSITAVGLLVLAPCCPSASSSSSSPRQTRRKSPATTISNDPPQAPPPPPPEASPTGPTPPARSRRRRRRPGQHHAGGGGGDSTTSSSQFVSDENDSSTTPRQGDGDDDRRRRRRHHPSIELQPLRTVPAPPRSAIATARRSRSQLMEQQRFGNNNNYINNTNMTQATATTAAGTATTHTPPLTAVAVANSHMSRPRSRRAPPPPPHMSVAAGSVLLYEDETIETELNTVEQEEQQQMNRTRRQWQQPSAPPPPFLQPPQKQNHHHHGQTTHQLVSNGDDGHDEYAVEYGMDGDGSIEYNVDDIVQHGNDHDDDDDFSVMPPLHPDQLAPEDAADAYDVGVLFPTRLYHNHHPFDDNIPKATTTTIPSSSSSSWERWGELLLDIANPFFETRHILNRALPITLANHLVLPLQTVCFALVIAKLVNTESALAYSVVELLFRCTIDDVSEAIGDAQANLQQQQNSIIIVMDDPTQILGNTLQLAILLQGVLAIPMLMAWRFGMDGTVLWLLGDPVLSNLAEQYTMVLIWERLLRSMLRGFLVPFRWMSRYESAAFDLIMFSSSLVLVVVLLQVVSATSLTTVAYVQLGTTFLTGVVKLLYVVWHGWFQPYRLGMWERIMLFDRTAVSAFLRQLWPLMVSTILELGEWDILLLIVSQLGRAEAATWIIFSLFWELFGNLTPGLGEALSGRIAEYLATGFHHEAILLSRKAVLFGYVLAGSVGAFLLVASPGITKVWTLGTLDESLRMLLVESSGLFSLAVAARIFSQLYWHLASAQGRFGLATLTSLAAKWLFMLPLSLLLVLKWKLDLRSILLVVGTGHAFKTFLLGYKVFGTDWDALSRSIRDRREEEFDAEQAYDDDDDDDDDDSDDDEEEEDEDDESSFDDDDNDDDDGSSDTTEKATHLTQDKTARETESESEMHNGDAARSKLTRFPQFSL